MNEKKKSISVLSIWMLVIEFRLVEIMKHPSKITANPNNNVRKLYKHEYKPLQFHFMRRKDKLKVYYTDFHTMAKCSDRFQALRTLQMYIRLNCRAQDLWNFTWNHQTVRTVIPITHAAVSENQYMGRPRREAWLRRAHTPRLQNISTLWVRKLILYWHR